MTSRIDHRLVVTIAGLAIPLWALDGVLLFDNVWLVSLPLLLFNPTELGGALPVEWGCFGPSGPPEIKQLGLIVLIAEALWSVSIVAVASILTLTCLAGTSTCRTTKQLTHTYSVTACLALLTFIGAMCACLQAFPQ